MLGYVSTKKGEKVMNYLEALAIFGLSDDYTAEKLKSTYYTLAKKYHSDINKKADDAIMQQINVAHGILKEQLKQPRLIEKADYQQAILCYQTNPKLYPSYLSSYLDNINSLVNMFLVKLTRFAIQDCTSFYNNALNNISILYAKIKDNYFKVNMIDETSIKEKINYNCSFASFYEQLESINVRYGKKAELEQKLDAEIEHYKTNPGYSHLQNILLEYKNNYLNDFNMTMNISDIIADFHQKMEMIFVECFTLLKKIKTVLNYVAENKNSVNPSIQELIDNVQFDLFYLDIDSENYINTIFQSQSNFTVCLIKMDHYIAKIASLNQPNRIKVDKTIYLDDKPLKQNIPLKLKRDPKAIKR